MYAKILANMVATSHQMNAKAEGDYIGPDGFLYCGKCHTKKETSVTVSYTHLDVYKRQIYILSIYRYLVKRE